MSQIICTKWHNTNKMAEYTNDINKEFGNIDDWFRINVFTKFGKKHIYNFLLKLS